MDNNRKAAPAGTAIGRGNRKAWSTPVLSRLEASDAEVSTRVTDDGVFTSS